MFTPNLSCGVTYTRKNEMVGWTDTGLIWWYSTTVLPVLLGTIGQDGQGFFRAVVAVLHGTMGIDTIGYYSTCTMTSSKIKGIPVGT